jgi:hypothetical protein
MKKVYILLITVLSSAHIQAQTASAVVFAEMGEKFTLYLNGEPQNTSPQVNIKVSGLTSEYYQARIDFENPMLEDFANNNFAVAKGFESTYIIKPGKKGGYVLRYNGQSEITGTASAPAVSNSTNTEAKKFAEVDDEVEEVETTKVQTGETTTVKQSGTVTAPQGGVSTTTTTTTKTSPSKPVKGENVNVGMNVGGVNMGININVTDSEMDMEESETVVEKTVTTTQTTTTSGTVNTAAKPREEVVIVKEVSQGACASAMSKDAFATAKNNISGKSFEDSKLTVAKQIAKSNCLTAQQISEILKVFGFEDTRLDFAKYAYDFCYNQNEYYLINESFQFESTIEELDAYLATKK